MAGAARGRAVLRAVPEGGDGLLPKEKKRPSRHQRQAARQQKYDPPDVIG